MSSGASVMQTAGLEVLRDWRCCGSASSPAVCITQAAPSRREPGAGDGGCCFGALGGGAGAATGLGGEAVSCSACAASSQTSCLSLTSIVLGIVAGAPLHRHVGDGDALRRARLSSARHAVWEALEAGGGGAGKGGDPVRSAAAA